MFCTGGVASLQPVFASTDDALANDSDHAERGGVGIATAAGWPTGAFGVENCTGTGRVRVLCVHGLRGIAAGGDRRVPQKLHMAVAEQVLRAVGMPTGERQQVVNGRRIAFIRAGDLAGRVLGRGGRGRPKGRRARRRTVSVVIRPDAVAGRRAVLAAGDLAAVGNIGLNSGDFEEHHGAGRGTQGRERTVASGPGRPAGPGDVRVESVGDRLIRTRGDGCAGLQFRGRRRGGVIGTLVQPSALGVGVGRASPAFAGVCRSAGGGQVRAVRELLVVVLDILEDSEADLTHVGGARGLAGPLADFGEDGEQKGGEDRYDSDNDEQFNQCKTTLIHSFVFAFLSDMLDDAIVHVMPEFTKESRQ